MIPKHLHLLEQLYEKGLRSAILETIQSGGIPEMFLGTMILNTAGNYSKNMKENYSKFRNEYETAGGKDYLTERDYSKMIDELTEKVLADFVKPNNEPPFEDDPDYSF